MIFDLLWGSPGDSTGPTSPGKQTRQRVLAVALKISAREGLAALTIGRLAKQVRMSKSGLFEHFQSKQALELATLEAAREVFATAVLVPAQGGRGGIERLWNLSDLWLKHIEARIFSGAYFFAGALFEYADRPGPTAGAVTRIAREWSDTLRKAVQGAQGAGEIDPDADAEQIAWELNGKLLGAHAGYLLGHDRSFRATRAALLRQLTGLATQKIPQSAFDSVAAWKKYVLDKR